VLALAPFYFHISYYDPCFGICISAMGRIKTIKSLVRQLVMANNVSRLHRAW